MSKASQHFEEVGMQIQSGNRAVDELIAAVNAFYIHFSKIEDALRAASSLTPSTCQKLLRQLDEINRKKNSMELGSFLIATKNAFDAAWRELP